MYELICRHFLACLSKDAKGYSTKVEVEIGGEIFKAKGFTIEEKNWLEIFVFEKWAD